MISLKGTRLGQFYTGYKNFKDQGGSEYYLNYSRA